VASSPPSARKGDAQRRRKDSGELAVESRGGDQGEKKGRSDRSGKREKLGGRRRDSGPSSGKSSQEPRPRRGDRLGRENRRKSSRSELRDEVGPEDSGTGPTDPTLVRDSSEPEPKKSREGRERREKRGRRSEKESPRTQDSTQSLDEQTPERGYSEDFANLVSLASEVHLSPRTNEGSVSEQSVTTVESDIESREVDGVDTSESDVIAGPPASTKSDPVEELSTEAVPADPEKPASSGPENPDVLGQLMQSAIDESVTLVARSRDVAKGTGDESIVSAAVDAGKRLLILGHKFRDGVAEFRLTGILVALVPVIRSMNEVAAEACDSVRAADPASATSEELEDHLRHLASALAACVVHMRQSKLSPAKNTSPDPEDADGSSQHRLVPASKVSAGGTSVRDLTIPSVSASATELRSHVSSATSLPIGAASAEVVTAEVLSVSAESVLQSSPRLQRVETRRSDDRISTPRRVQSAATRDAKESPRKPSIRDTLADIETIVRTSPPRSPRDSFVSTAQPVDYHDGTHDVNELRSEVARLTDQLIQTMSDLGKAQSAAADHAERLERAERRNQELVQRLQERDRKIQSLELDRVELQQLVLNPQEPFPRESFELPDYDSFESSTPTPVSAAPAVAVQAVVARKGFAVSPRQERVERPAHAHRAPERVQELSQEEKTARRRSLVLGNSPVSKDIYFNFDHCVDSDETILWATAPQQQSEASRSLRYSESGRRGASVRKGPALPFSAKIQIIAGRNLPAIDSSGLSNPYVMLGMVPASSLVDLTALDKARAKKTRTAKKTLNPLWNDQFDLQFSSPTEEAVHISVMHWNVRGHGTSMGNAMISLDDMVFDNPKSFWIPISGGKGEISVELELHARDTAERPATTRVLKAATRAKVFDRLCPPEKANRDSKFVLNWCLTYRMVMSGKEFLEALIERYRGPDKDDFASDSLKFQRTLRAIQNSVGYVLHTWLSNTSDIKLDHSLQHAVEQFLRDAQPPTAYLAQCSEICEQDFNTKSCDNDHSDEDHEHDRPFDDSPSKRRLSGTTSSKILLAALQGERLATELTIDEIVPREFAEQFTLMEYECVVHLAENPHEFVGQAWNKRNSEQNAPSILAYIDWFNRASLWFQTLILRCEDKQARAVMIAKIIKIGSEFVKLNNFNGVMEIVTALHSSAVSRLTRTWAILPKALMELFDVQSQLLSPDGNFKQYRAALVRTKHCLPYVGVWLTDLTFIDDANNDVVDSDVADGEPLINFEKLYMVAERLVLLKRALETPYTFQVSKEIRAAISNSESDCWSETDLFRVSLLRQPRANSSDGDDDGGGERFDSKAFAKVSAAVMQRGSGRNFVDTNAAHLTTRDWKLLLTCAQLVNRKKDDVIVTQGQRNEYLFRLHKGVCRVEKTGESETGEIRTIILPHQLKPPSMFGEMSCLGEHGIASASVVSDDDRTMIYQMEMSFIEGLFATEPGLSMRFFNYAAHKLADMLVNMGGGKKKASKRDHKERRPRQEHSADWSQSDSNDGEISVDTYVQHKFGVDNRDLVLKIYKCGLKKKLLYNGSLYVTQRHICFGARAFGAKAKKKVPFKEIAQIHNLDPSKMTIQRLNHGKLRFVFADESEAETAYRFIQRIWQRRNLRSSSMEAPQAGSTRVLSLQEAEEENKANDTFSVLPAADWELLLSGAKSVTVPRDEIIITQGQKYQRLYQISRGRCRIELDKAPPPDSPEGTPSEHLVLGTMEQGELFGEISFLRGVGASATVIADSETVDLTIIEGYFVKTLFGIDPSFAGRFYKYLAALLAHRIRLRGA
jgi:CRP-like cAMP-binding protein